MTVAGKERAKSGLIKKWSDVRFRRFAVVSSTASQPWIQAGTKTAATSNRPSLAENGRPERYDPPIEKSKYSYSDHNDGMQPGVIRNKPRKWKSTDKSIGSYRKYLRWNRHKNVGKANHCAYSKKGVQAKEPSPLIIEMLAPVVDFVGVVRNQWMYL